MATASELLRKAAEDVDVAVKQLDPTQVPCPACGREGFVHKAEGFVFRELAALPDKLRAQADKLDAAMAPPRRS